MAEVLHQRFQVVRPLGEGGMGVVVEAIDLRTGRPVAVKILRPHDLANPQAVERFKREAFATSALRHPHIVEMVDFLEAPPPLLALELLRGEPLRAAMRRGQLPEAYAVAVATQVLSALGAAHRVGIVHRDLKPANVFLVGTPDGRPWAKLLDFGVAKLAEYDGPALTRSSHVVGTAQYMSPEQIKGGAITERSDLFAMGLLLYEMLTGQRAHDGGSTHESMLKILNGTPLPPHSRIRAEMMHLLAHATALDPARRFPTADAMAAALATLPPLGAFADATGTTHGPPSHATSTSWDGRSDAGPPATWHGSQAGPPSALQPALVAQPPRSSAVLKGIGLLALVATVATVAVLATRHFDASVAPPSAVASAASSVPRAVASVAPPPSATTAESKRSAGKPAAADPAAAKAGGKVGAACTKSADCAGEGACENGTCTCASTGFVCGGICRGRIDNEGCGTSCERCAANAMCVLSRGGTSNPECLTCAERNATACGAHQCVDLQTSQGNCGACGKVCSGTCGGGVCYPTKGLGQACSRVEECRGAGAECTGGTCRCPASTYACGNLCNMNPCAK